MSVWKKATKAHQKSHKERHQPEERAHLGLLEKKKDYVRRARDFNDKKETLKVLRKRALNRNPDEFYHHMINSKSECGKHFEKETEDEDTPEQVRLMRSQDVKYLMTKKTQELKKIEKLQTQMHLTSVDRDIKHTHIYFHKDMNKNEIEKQVLEKLAERELPLVDLEALSYAAKRRKHIYEELGKRINREKELSVIQHKIEIKKHLENKKNVLPPKRIKKGNKNRASIYEWKYERKK